MSFDILKSWRFHLLSQPLYLSVCLSINNNFTNQALTYRFKVLLQSKRCITNAHDHSFDIHIKVYLLDNMSVLCQIKQPQKRLKLPEQVLRRGEREDLNVFKFYICLLLTCTIHHQSHCHQPVPRRSIGHCLSSLVIRSWASAGRASSPSGQMISSLTT